MPNLYIIAGPNGAGKTTAAFTLLPNFMNCREFVNADEIARGISPFNVESVAFEAGRIMLQRIDYLLSDGADFAIETTLSTRSYVQMVNRAKALGYQTYLFFVFVSSPDLAVERVALRVASGGHAIPVEVIHRRYKRSLLNLFQLYLPICDYFMVVNNSSQIPVQVAEGETQRETVVYENELWIRLNQMYGRYENQR